MLEHALAEAAEHQAQAAAAAQELAASQAHAAVLARELRASQDLVGCKLVMKGSGKDLWVKSPYAEGEMMFLNEVGGANGARARSAQADEWELAGIWS